MNGFIYVFQVSKMVNFTVSYIRRSSISEPYFSTSCILFSRGKKSWQRAGQCQEEVLEKDSLAYRFFKKWDKKHLMRLDINEEKELARDMSKLCMAYNWISELNNDCVSWWREVELSKLPLKKSDGVIANF